MRNPATPSSSSALTVDVLQIPGSAFSVDRHRRIIAWNEGAARLFGISADEALGRQCSEIIDSGLVGACQFCSSRRGCGPASRSTSTLTMTSSPSTSAVNAAASPAAPSSAESASAEKLFTLAATTESSRMMMIALRGRSVTGELRIVHILGEHPRQPTPAPAASLQVSSAELAPPVAGYALADAAIDAPIPPRLTPSETRILRMLADGSSTQDIARTLSISYATTRNHIAHILMKLGVNTRLEAVVLASRLGML